MYPGEKKKTKNWAVFYQEHKSNTNSMIQTPGGGGVVWRKEINTELILLRCLLVQLLIHIIMNNKPINLYASSPFSD